MVGWKGKISAAEGATGDFVVGRSKLKDTDTISYALDLNEANVQAIFNRCLKTAETKEIEYATLFRKEFGYEKTEAPVHFDQETIKANKQTIKYLFGQVQIVHRGEFSITEGKAAARYGQKASIIKMNPTLSPKDPAFPAWWEQHKSEWEA